MKRSGLVPSVEGGAVCGRLRATVRMTATLVARMMAAMMTEMVAVMVVTTMTVTTPALASTTAAPGACPSAAEIEPAMLQGRWQIEWTDGERQRDQAPWRLTLGPHPEYAGSLKGTLVQGGRTHLVVADWDDETLTMEESEDGVRIAATWQASASPGRCGRELRGQRWRDGAPEEGARRFRMRALP